MSDKLDRRTMLTGAAFASVLVLPVAATAGSHGTIGCEEPDPIFSAIEAHRKAFIDWGNGSDENIERLGDIEKEALYGLLDEAPTTLAGVVALSRYSAELTMLFSAMDYSRSAAHPTDEKKSVDWSYYIHRHVADAVLNLSSGAQP
jgi:hypothetical protein